VCSCYSLVKQLIYYTKMCTHNYANSPTERERGANQTFDCSVNVVRIWMSLVKYSGWDIDTTVYTCKSVFVCARCVSAPFIVCNCSNELFSYKIHKNRKLKKKLRHYFRATRTYHID
jgi:hypothetical protein